MKKVALLGFGNIGKNYYLSSLKKKFLIKKILKKKKLNSKFPGVTFFNNFDTLLKNNNIDGYILATPVSSHYEYAQKIIKKKKPFIIEKPIVENIKELENLYKLCKNYNQSIFVNHTDLYNKAFFEFLKKLKTIGAYKQINMSFGKLQTIKIPDIDFAKKFHLPSFDWLPHPIAIILKLAGLPKKVLIKKNSITIKNRNIFQTSKIHFYCKKFLVNLNFSNEYKIPKKRILIKGSKSTIIYDGYKSSVLIKEKKDKFFKKVFSSKTKPLDNLLDLFCLSLKNKQAKKDINLAYKTMKILFQIENKMKDKLSFKI